MSGKKLLYKTTDIIGNKTFLRKTTAKEHIIIKHSEMTNCVNLSKSILETPDYVEKDNYGGLVFYRKLAGKIGKIMFPSHNYLVVVTHRKQNGDYEVKTFYPTNKSRKWGKLIWPVKQKKQKHQ